MSTAISGVSTQIGGSGSTLAAQVTTQIGSVRNTSTVLNTAISDVSGLLGSGDSSLTSNTDLYRILNDANSGSSSGLIAKLNGTGSATILDGVNALAGSIDGSASVTGSSSSNLNANLLAQTHLVNAGATQLSTAISGVSTQIGGSGSTLAAKMTTQIGSVENGATVLNTAISDVSGLLGSGSSLTASSDLYRILSDASDSTTSGLIAKLNGTGSTTILGGVNALAGSIDGSASVTGSSSSNLNAKLSAVAGSLGSSGSDLTSQVTSLGTSLGGTANAMIIGPVGSSFSLTSYNGIGSQSFGSTPAIVSGTTITLSIGGEIYSYVASSSDTVGNLTFSGTSGNTFVINTRGTHYNNSSESANAIAIAADINSSYLANTQLSPAGSLNSHLRYNQSRINNSGTVLATAISDIFTRLGDGGTGYVGDIYTRIGAPGSTLTTIKSMIGTSADSTGSIAADLGNTATGARSIAAVIGQPGGTNDSLYARIGAPVVDGSASNLSTLIGGTGSDLATRLGDPGANFASIAAMIGGSATTIKTKLGNSGTANLSDQISPSAASIQAAITSVSGSLGTSGSDLESQVTNLGASLGSSSVALVTGVNTSATVSFSSFGGHAPQTFISNPFTTSTSGAYTINVTIGGHIYSHYTGSSDASFSSGTGYYFNGGTGFGDLVIQTNTAFANQDEFKDALNTYFASGSTLYPSGVVAQVGVLSNTQIGVSGSASLADKLGNTGGGDLSIAALIGSPSGTPTDSLYTRIGLPKVNNVTSNLSTLIGGSNSSLAAQLGDPRLGGAGSLSGLIRNNHGNLATVNGFDCSGFDSATTLYAQLNAFVTIMSNSPGSAQIRIPAATYNSLADILAALNHA